MTTGGKGSAGNFFEDFSIGQRFAHAVPRTLHGGDFSLYMALTGDRRPLSSSTEFARSLGYPREVAPELLVFHVVFGKSVAEVSFNATANLGYADVRFLRPVYPGDTLTADSEVIGLRQASKGDAGIVYVRTRGTNQKGQEVLTFVRWVMVAKRDVAAPAPTTVVPVLPETVAPADLPVPATLNLQRFADLAWATGGAAWWDDYAVGERIVHPGGMTIEEADHVQATRMYGNTARVHFDAHQMASSRFGRRLVYGGHVISVAAALAQGGLETLLAVAAWNGGVHAHPTFAGDTIYAWTEVAERAALPGRDDLGALRLRLFACKGHDPATGTLPDDDARVVLRLDYWGLFPRRRG